MPRKPSGGGPFSEAPLHWSNWAGNVACQPRFVHAPTSEEDIVAVVRSAAVAGERVKVVGSGHSCSSIAAADDAHLVTLSRYNRVLRVDPVARQVTVQAGIRLDVLNEVLASHGLALDNLGAITEQTAAGAISTGTHGTGLRHGSLAQQVSALTLVTASGDVIAASPCHNADVFAAARVGLGALGVVSTVTFACVPAFNMQLTEEPATLTATLDDLDHWLEQDYFGMWWVPHTQYVYRRVATYSADVATAPPGRLSAWVAEELVGKYVQSAGWWGACEAPRLGPLVNRGLRRVLLGKSQTRVGRSDHVLSGRVDIANCVLEYAIPLERARDALECLRQLIDRAGVHAHFPVDIRFGPAEDAWLSPAFGRQTCYIGLVTHRPFGRAVAFEHYYRQADALFAALGGRPHWGKIHYRTARALAESYPMWEPFQAVRRELDPHGMFLNAYLARVFGTGERGAPEASLAQPLARRVAAPDMRGGKQPVGARR